MRRSSWSQRAAFFVALALAGGQCIGSTLPPPERADDPPDSPPLIDVRATVLIRSGATTTWRFADQGTDLGQAWRDPDFDDAPWLTGGAPLGYGNDDEITRLSPGEDPARPTTTSYFRSSFSVIDPLRFTKLRLFLLRDDGAIVYLNGVEVLRSNLPAGAITFDTLATARVDGEAEKTFQTATVDAALLRAGRNVLAVEVHQAADTSSDLRFDLALTAENGITRGPYLQQATPTSATVHFRTDTASQARAYYGETLGVPTAVVEELTPTTEHVLRMWGLKPATTYHYSLFTGGQVRVGGDGKHTFTTPPVPGTEAPTRIWVIGDSGTANANARQVRDAYLQHAQGRRTDVWLMLGDNAYHTGTDVEYQAAVFDVYTPLFASTFLWPTIGNHDAAGRTLLADDDFPYLKIFDLPSEGEAGGLPSGTERYYSFDHGNIHFICLDSMTSDRSPDGAMIQWLRADLAVNANRWLIAFWHHPPYSKGSHDTDASHEVESHEIRANILPVLEQAGVDLVLSGHSHAYERSFLIDGHYGRSSTFSAAMKKSGGSGRTEEGEAYQKVAGPHLGAVYVVAGASGQAHGGSLNHPAMFISLNEMGSLVLDINGKRLDAQYLRDTGVVADTFSIVKD